MTGRHAAAGNLSYSQDSTMSRRALCVELAVQALFVTSGLDSPRPRPQRPDPKVALAGSTAKPSPDQPALSPAI